MLPHGQPLPNMTQHHLAAQKSQKILPVHQQQPQTPNIPGNSQKFQCAVIP